MIYESVIKVVASDPPERRARDIAEGIAYACALLQDVVSDDLHDEEARRG